LHGDKPKKRHIDVEAMVEECLLDDEGQVRYSPLPLANKCNCPLGCDRGTHRTARPALAILYRLQKAAKLAQTPCMREERHCARARDANSVTYCLHANATGRQSECFASLVRTLEKASMDGDLVSDLDRERLSEAGYSAGELEAMFGALDVSGMGEEGEDPIPSPISSE